jgi:bifunctional non-homologous end joining protein LigD
MAKSHASTGRPPSSARALLSEIETPMLASTGVVDDPSAWTFEIKYDGYRILAAKQAHEVRLGSRRGLDWTARFRPIAEAVAGLAPRELVLDGELCALAPDGRPSFHRLQGWVEGDRQPITLAYVAFDLLRIDGEDLRAQPLEIRRARLESILAGRPGPISPSVIVDPPRGPDGRPDCTRLLEAAQRAGLEGFVAKKRGSRYHAGRTTFWRKLKCTRSQSFVVVGYTPLSGRRDAIVGGLVLASADDAGVLVHVGAVGSGLDDATRRTLALELEQARLPRSPIAIAERIPDARWSEPRIVVEVEFQEWSDDRKIRFPVFRGRRDDKQIEDCTIEPPPPAEAERAPSSVRPSNPLSNPPLSNPPLSNPPLSNPPLSNPPLSNPPLSNPTKILYPRDAITKQEVLAYYEEIAPVILPHLRDRPLTIQRWPDGIDGQQWYQQHAPDGAPPAVRTIALEGRRAALADGVESLRWLANLAALTLHVGSARIGALDRPDWIVLDLDPGPAGWPQVVEVGRAVRILLERLEIESFPKTTGKRGLHVLVPVSPGATHDDAARLAGLLAQAVAKALPQVATIERTIAKRRGRLYVDAVQNGAGRTIAATYTLRAVDGAQVSTPIRWSELETIEPAALRLRTIRARIEAHGDLTAGVLDPRRGVDVAALLARIAR